MIDLVGILNALLLLAMLSLSLIVFSLLLSVFLTDLERFGIRITTNMADSEVDCITDPSKVNKERTDCIWNRYSGEATSSDVEGDGFVLECYDQEEKFTVMFKNIESFESYISRERGGSSYVEKECWRCGDSFPREKSMRGSSSKIYRLFIFEFIFSYEEDLEVCQDCQKEFYRFLVTETDLKKSESVVANRI